MRNNAVSGVLAVLCMPSSTVDGAWCLSSDIVFGVAHLEFRWVRESDRPKVFYQSGICAPFVFKS